MNRNFLLSAFIGSAMVCASGAAAAAELIVTGDASKAGNTSMFSMDLLSDGDARGVQARIALPKGVKVDTSGCLSALPSGFQGTCDFKQGEVRLMAFSFEDRKLPAGLLELGMIKVSGPMKGDADLRVADFQVVNAAGKSIQSKSTVAFGGSKPRSPGHEQVR